MRHFPIWPKFFRFPSLLEFRVSLFSSSMTFSFVRSVPFSSFECPFLKSLFLFLNSTYWSCQWEASCRVPSLPNGRETKQTGFEFINNLSQLHDHLSTGDGIKCGKSCCLGLGWRFSRASKGLVRVTGQCLSTRPLSIRYNEFGM